MVVRTRKTDAETPVDEVDTDDCEVTMVEKCFTEQKRKCITKYVKVRGTYNMQMKCIFVSASL